MPVTTLEGPWSVAFDTAWGGPEKVVFESLSDWSAHPVDGIRHYSGIATYSKTFNLPESFLAKNSTEIYLDLGIVKNMARLAAERHPAAECALYFYHAPLL